MSIGELLVREGGLERYASKLRWGRMWGGLLEIAVFAVLSNQTVAVYL